MTLLLMIVGAVILLYLIGAGFFAYWAAREERRQEAERARFEQCMKASTPPRDWPSPTKPKGITNKFPRAS